MADWQYISLRNHTKTYCNEIADSGPWPQAVLPPNGALILISRLLAQNRRRGYSGKKLAAFLKAQSLSWMLAPVSEAPPRAMHDSPILNLE